MRCANSSLFQKQTSPHRHQKMFAECQCSPQEDNSLHHLQMIYEPAQKMRDFEKMFLQTDLK